MEKKLSPDRDARYTKWKMAVQRSLGWATTKKSITMTGQAKRKNSILNEIQSPPQSRKNSGIDKNIDLAIDKPVTDDGVDDYIQELIQYSARKFSIFVPLQTQKDEHTILDDIEYYQNKKECDYGMCQCCHKKRIQTDWETIEEIIENDPEIIFDSDDNPIVVEPKIEPIVGYKKRLPVENIPALFKNICQVRDTLT